jgi:hypothetical protein
MPDVTVTWTLTTALAPMEPLSGPGPGGLPDVQPGVLMLRFVWNDPPAAQGVTSIRARVWPVGGTRPTAPTVDFGLGTSLAGGLSYGDVTGLVAGQAYSWELRPAREE